MGNLLNNNDRLEELLTHIRKREGVVNYFYCDNRGYVTVGIGTLIDGSNPLNVFLKNNPNIIFRNKITNKIASVIEIIQDWNNVKSAFNPQRPQNEKFYSTIAKLRINNTSMDYLMMKEVRTSIVGMYKSRPLSKSLDEYIQMAIIDVRYNPAGINPIYTGTQQTITLWKFLNKLDLENAFKEFHRLWYLRIAWGNSKNKARYLDRQSIRERWFGKGIERMQALNLIPKSLITATGTFIRPIKRGIESFGNIFFDSH
jgi:GH24 family phage-related lysozyme (muramidase)